MIKVALTGNIASGKSTVQKILERAGYKVFDTDIAGHKLLDSLPAIRKIFNGYDIYDIGGKIEREKLGKLVFTNPELKKQLEYVIHPAITDELLKFFEENKKEDIVFAGIPLLFEADMRNLFDKAILIYTDDATRKQRLILRNGYTQEYADIRMNAQMSQDKKKLLCDYVLYNNGTINNLEISVKNLVEQLTMH